MIEPVPGTLLIAEPFLKDPNFSRTVVFICDHQKEGSLGFVLNKIYDYHLDELMNNASELKIPVFYGGPVQMNTIHFLHQYPDEIAGSCEVLNGIYWGGNIERAIDLLKTGQIDPSRIRFYIGYSGWSEGQLSSEMKEKTWLTSTATRKIVFHGKSEEIWKEALKELGGDYEMMINYPIDPQLN